MDIFFNLFTFLLAFIGLFSAFLFFIVVRNIFSKGFHPIQGVLPVVLMIVVFASMFLPAIFSLSSLKDAVTSRVDSVDTGVKLKPTSAAPTSKAPAASTRPSDNLYGN